MEKKLLALELDDGTNPTKLEQVVKIAEELFDRMAFRLEQLFKERELPGRSDNL